MVYFIKMGGNDMKTRPYGNTGKSVSEVGFGAWQIGSWTEWANTEEGDIIRLIDEAYEQGVNFFDTAPSYGWGVSEEMLGKALKGKRDQVVINTKFGHSDRKTDFSAEKISESVENSLRRLKTDYIDSVLLHNPPSEFLNGRSPHYEAFEKLKDEGKILAYGASIDTSKDMIEIMSSTKSGILEVMFNIFYQETAEAFKMASEKNVGLIIKVPLDSGWLSGRYNALSRFDDMRSRWSEKEIIRRAELLDKISFITDKKTSMIQAALRFILSYSAVTSVIPGIKSLDQLMENISASQEKMPKEHVERLKEIWRSELKDDSLGW
jgi:aryl-alcohol dehydrogenase-like predicted oxidoreductase